jgi:trehalose synthase-fused probable maltokinase
MAERANIADRTKPRPGGSKAGAFIARQRWFGSKARAIRAVTPLDELLLAPVDRPPSAAAPAGAIRPCTWERGHRVEGRFPSYVLETLGIEFHSGPEENYFVPRMFAAPAGDGSAGAPDGAAGDSASDGGADALADAPFGREWVRFLLSGETWQSAHGAYVSTVSAAGLAAVSLDLEGMTTRPIGAEQSNSSLVARDRTGRARLVAKTFRRMAAGINPELEITRFLTEKTLFRQVPMLAGAIEYHAHSGRLAEMHPPLYTIAVGQLYIPNAGDGWSFVLAELTAALSAGDRTRASRLSDAIGVLGRRTGDLHVALASSAGDSAFAPEPIAPEDTAWWALQIEQSAAEAARELKLRHTPARPALDLTSADLEAVAAILEKPPHVARELDALTTGAHRIRVHGDYHLGQVLRTLTDDFVIFDFEGEPARPLAERRRKLCVLKDVAGMMRSLDYASNTVTRQNPRLGEMAAEWQAEAARTFWHEYRRTVRQAAVPLLPPDDAACERALKAFCFEKAVYELHYELNNRPDWVAIPLAGLKKLAT